MFILNEWMFMLSIIFRYLKIVESVKCGPVYLVRSEIVDSEKWKSLIFILSDI